MRHFTIKALLVLLAGITLLGFGSTLALFTLQDNRVTAVFERIVNVEEALLGQLQEMYAQGLQTEQATRNVVLNPSDQKARDNYAVADGKFRKALETAQGLAKGPLADELRKVAPLWEEGNGLKGQVMALALDGKQQAAVELLNTKETKKWREIKDIIQKQIVEQAKKSQATFEEYKSGARRWFWMGFGSGFLLLLGMAALLWQGGRMILRPLRSIHDFAQCQAEGRFDQCLTGSYSGELKEVGEALQAMAAKVQESLGFTQGVLKGIAPPYVVVDGNQILTMTNPALLEILQHDGKPEDFYGQNVAHFFYGDAGRRTVLSDAMEQNTIIMREVDLTGRKGGVRRILIAASPLHNAINGALMGALCLYTDLTELRAKESHILAQNQAVTQAARDAEGVVSALLDCSRRLSDQVARAEDGAAQQRERAGATAEAMGDMSGAIQGSAESADVAAKGAESAANKAEEGAEVVRQVVASVEEVRALALALKENMGGLGRQAEAIGQIMNVISDIADQTTMLALTASNEAATKEVGEAIRGIQDGTRANVAQAEQSARTIERTSELAGRSGEALREIVGMVNDTTLRVRGIATAVELQSSASTQVNAAVEEINDIAQQTAAGMDAASRDVEELRRLADQLREVVQGMAAK